MGALRFVAFGRGVAPPLALGLLALALPAAAGEIPRAEGFGGYSYARSADESLHGWNASLGYNFGRWGVEADLTGHHGSLATGTDLDRLSFMAGPRLSWRAGRATPFLRLLVGGVRTSTGLTVQNVNISARETQLGGAAGGGLDLGLGRHWGLRLQGDYLMVSSGGQTQGDPRAAFGISYRLGRRGLTPTAAR